MKFILIIPYLFLSCFVIAQPALTESYISTYKHIAISEMHRAGIPASITLAQGLLESNWGRSTLAVKSNNHFGIKCSGQWSGEQHFRFDDERDRFGKKKKSCFRVYDNAEASFIDHSEFLTDEKKVKRYGFLFNYSPDDYSSWAHGLKKAGYASDPKYAHKLIGIIEKYDLWKYDQEIDQEEVIAEVEDDYYRINYINSCKVIHAKGGENLKDLSKEMGVSSRKLFRYNEHILKKDERLKRGERVYLEEKKSFYLGKEKEHLVKGNENIVDISKLYGVDIEYLRKINQFKDDMALEANDKVYLSRNRSAKKQSNKQSTRAKVPVQIKPSRELVVDNSNYLFDDALTPAGK